MTNSDTSIRVKNKTKEELGNLDFVRKHSYNEIMEYLIEFYKQEPFKKGFHPKQAFEKKVISKQLLRKVDKNREVENE